jgi:hypothetical protein
MYDQDVFDQMAHHESHFEEFVRPMAASAAGYYVGHRLSKTRWGQRFEHSPFVGRVLAVLLFGIGAYALYCAITFVYFLFSG